MTKFSFAAVALLLAAAVPAMAAEGNGEPFPGPNAAVNSAVGTPTYRHANQDPYQYYGAGQTSTPTTAAATVHPSTDPYPFRAPSMTIAMPAPVTGPQNGDAASVQNVGRSTHALATPDSAPHG